MYNLTSPLTPPAKYSAAANIVKRVFAFIGLAILGFMVVIVLTLLAERVLFKKVVPMAFGFSPLTVLTPSMEPEISPGDMVIIHSQGSYAVGDTVTYVLTGGNASVTHEIIETYVEGGRTYYITKGVNNPTKDPLPVEKSQVAGKVILVIPQLGTFLEWLKTPIGIMLILIFVLIIIAAVYVIRM